MFGAVGGKRDIRKGFKLLELALKNLKKLNSADDINVIIFGGNKSDTYPEINFKDLSF